MEIETPVWALVRVAVGYVLLDRGGMTSFLHRMQGRTPWGSKGLLFMLALRLTPLQRQVQSDLWRLAAVKGFGKNLPRLLSALPEGISYINVGHSNLTEHTLEAVAAHPGGKTTVMIHDTIPLDFPDYSRPEAVNRFDGLLRRTLNHADMILCNSVKTKEDVERHAKAMAVAEGTPADTAAGALPPCVVAYLGVDLTRADEVAIPSDLPRNRPLFLSVGTTEARKNHTLLLDIWEGWDEAKDGPRPVLGIAGARGWRNEAFFDRLDASDLKGRDIFEWTDLSDKAIAALMAHSHALLFPSYAEGYGLPPVEAAALQTPVISADLPSVREVLGELPVYLTADDSYPWKTAIKSRLEDGRSGTTGPGAFKPPTWEEHFKIVLKMI